MDEHSARRIAVLSGQLVIQDCAATNTMRYGRAASAGARFARPCTSEQAGLDHHKEAALQHAVRSYAVAERMGARHDVPDPPSFARPAVEPQGPGGSDVAARPKARRVLLTSETRSLGWKPRVTAVETERMYVVTLWLPGADARSLRINQTARRLTVSGSRGRAAGGQGAERFALGWDLPANVDAAGITARASGNARDPRGEWRQMNSLTLLLPKLA